MKRHLVRHLLAGVVLSILLLGALVALRRPEPARRDTGSRHGSHLNEVNTSTLRDAAGTPTRTNDLHVLDAERTRGETVGARDTATLRVEAPRSSATKPPTGLTDHSAVQPTVSGTRIGGIAVVSRELKPPEDFVVRDGTLDDAPPQRDLEVMRRRFVEVPIKPVRMQQSWSGFGRKNVDAGMEMGGVPSAKDQEAMVLRSEGVNLLLRGDAGGAVERLKNALGMAESEHTRLRIEWALARAYARNGQIKESKAIYEKLAAR
jgi:hypothetical protein